MNNRITLISPVQWGGGYIFAADSPCVLRSSANFLTVFCGKKNANLLDAELKPDFNAK